MIFANGIAYNSTITGVLDPATSKLSAILQGTSNFTITVGANVTNIFAQGSLTAQISQITNGTAGTSTASRLDGTAALDIFNAVGIEGPVITSTVTFKVTGFQQNATYSVPPAFNLTNVGG